ncbi:rRNA maturation RNase YbeY [Bacteroidales bacterium OttesenSCG-928-C03]|nr:rRNA maturation RNase YbeY [Bacteroidales bacterium OttesenSCG-928-E04]MDL2309154.1 rRNA maturation RNase YbeY [Bacteroidales bacterium OttesenSCG-928-C03]MDL2326961.1 rRNA maturation RNase YbeY [Bacteroidales bacterium OttesenSCG-928-A14]
MILFQTETKFALKNRLAYKTWIKSIAQHKGKKVGDINYIFCADDYLLKINKQYLDHDTYTDIITFDYSEDDTIHGDIFISIERVGENAEMFSVTFFEELLRVMAHGILHLCGYKDKLEQDEKKMREQEDWAIKMFAENNQNIVNKQR